MEERGYGRDERSFGNRDYDRGYGRSYDRDREVSRGDSWRERSSSDRDSRRGGYRPVTGDYSRSEGFYAASGVREQPSGRSAMDPHYHDWRRRQIDELDRDYDDYRREHQSSSKTISATGAQRRSEKRGLLGQIREHMEVVGNDDEHVGTVDRVAGDRIILDPVGPGKRRRPPFAELLATSTGSRATA